MHADCMMELDRPIVMNVPKQSYEFRVVAN